MTIGGFILRAREDYSFVIVGLTLTLLGLYRLRSLYKSSSENGLLEYDDRLITKLQHSLDANYSVVLKYSFPDYDGTVPYVVLGPSGLFVVHRWEHTGEIHVENDEWVVEREQGTDRYKSPFVELERDVQSMESFLRRNNESRIEVNGRVVMMKHTAEGEVLDDDRVVYLRDLSESLVPETDDSPLDWEELNRLEEVLGLSR